jgi:fluoroquinolone transport system permease protein
MRTIRAVKALGPIDLRSIQRDPLLRWMFAAPVGMALVLRWGTPYAASEVQRLLGFDLVPYYGLLLSVIGTLLPVLFGMVIGFLLLDQRDDRTLTALQVTPLTLTGYLVYRVAMPIALSLLLTPLVLAVAGLVDLGLGALVLFALAVAPLAPLFALFLASVAENKVQGFALQKAAGVVLLPPAIAYFVAPPWQLLFGLAPTYWPAKYFWAVQAGDPVAGVYLLVALFYETLLIALLLGRFKRVMTRA